MRALIALTVMVLTLPLAACGFSPMYAENGLRGKLSGISLTVPETRTGFLIEQELTQRLNLNAEGVKPYELRIRATENVFSVGYRIDDTASRSELTSNVVYMLYDSRTNKLLFRGSFTEVVSYAADDSPFVDVTAQQNAQKRIAEAIAVRVESELAQYFLGGK